MIKNSGTWFTRRMATVFYGVYIYVIWLKCFPLKTRHIICRVQ